MGYDQELFLDQGINEEFICSICQNVLQDPVMLHCEHMFCRSCIMHWCLQGVLASCPIDRKGISIDSDFKSPPRPFLNLVNGLKVHCQFWSFGCDSIMSLGDKSSHELKCELNPDITKPCPSHCGAMIKKVEAETHNCIQYLKEKIVGLEKSAADQTKAFDKKFETLLKQMESTTTTVVALHDKVKYLENNGVELRKQMRYNLPRY